MNENTLANCSPSPPVDTFYKIENQTAEFNTMRASLIITRTVIIRRTNRDDNGISRVRVVKKIKRELER